MIDTDQLVSEFRTEVEWPVLMIGTVLPVLFVLLLAVVPDKVEGAVSAVTGVLYTTGGLLFLVPMFLFLLFCLVIAVSPWGKTKLGDTDPEFGRLTYFAMFFSAGIAAGIVFWGPAEALYHYTTVPPFLGAEAGTNAAATGALQYTMFHWGFTAPSAYAVLGIPIAYFAYNRGAPLRVSTVLAPVVGLDGLDGFWAKTVDVLAVFATLGGIAATLGFVGPQFLTGIEYQWGVQIGTLGAVLLVMAFMVMFLGSVLSGIRRGIRRISLLNVLIMSIVAVVVFAVGPTLTIVENGLAGSIGYLTGLPMMSVYTGTGGAVASDWVSAWTVFYWAWWLSWAPFTGLFLARVSKGRTIRDVVATSVGAFTLVTIAWFVIMGATAIDAQRTGAADILGAIGEHGTAVSGFPLFQALPMGSVLVVGFLAMVITFFVTSGDSATLSLAMMASDGDEHPSFGSRLYWGVLLGIIASALLIVGGTGILQSAAVVTGTPFAVVGLLAIVGLTVELAGSRGARAPREEPESSVDHTGAEPAASQTEPK
jgi:glycine betaine transporter